MYKHSVFISEIFIKCLLSARQYCKSREHGEKGNTVPLVREVEIRVCALLAEDGGWKTVNTHLMALCISHTSKHYRTRVGPWS